MATNSRAGSEQHQERPLSAIYTELGHALFSAGRYADATQAFREASRDLPNVAELQVALGRAYQALQRNDEALHAYLESVPMAPGAASLPLGLCHGMLTPELANRAAEWVDAVWRPALERLALDAETRGSACLFLGRVNLYHGAFPAALLDFQAALRYRPRDVYSLEGLGESLWRTGDPDRALPVLEQAVRLADELGDPDRRGATRIRLARTLMDRKRYSEAEAVIQQGLLVNDAHAVESLTLLAQCNLELCRPEPALRAADAAVQRDDGHTEAHAVRAAALYDLQRYEEAIKAADTVLRIAPGNLVAVRIKAQAIIDGKMEKYIPQAVRLLDVYLRQRPADTVRHRLLIRVLRESQRPVEEVVNALRRAVAGETDEDRPAFLMELAETLLAAEHAEEAIHALEDAAKINPTAQSAQWWQFYGDAQVQAGQEETAERSYEQGLRLDPVNALMLEHNAELLFKRSSYPQAIGLWRRLVECSPPGGAARVQIAEALRRQGDLQGALKELEEVMKSLNWADYSISAQAYQVKADTLAELKRPCREIADACVEAGRQYSWGNNAPAALALFRRAREVDETHQPACWWLSDALLRDSYRQTPPYANEASLEESLKIWEAGYALGPPANGDRDYSWAYTVRALINDQFSRLHSKDRVKLWWAAIAFLERAVLLREDEVYRWTYLARYYRYLDRKDAALAVIRRALELDPHEIAALDERSAVQAESAAKPEDWSTALDTIETRMKVKPDPWLGVVKGLVLLYLDRAGEAVALFTQQIEANGDDIWARNLRAFAYLLLNQPVLARDDYQRIWGRNGDPRFASPGDRAKFATAACHLAFLTHQPSLLEEAIAIFQEVRRDPQERIDDSLACCYLVRGGSGDLEAGEALFHRYIEEAIAAPNLECLERFDLPLLETRLRDLPHREQALAVIQRIRPKLAEARKKLDRVHPRTEAQEADSAREELRGAVRIEEAKGLAGEWAWIAAQAGLARFHASQMDWVEAAAIYRQLLQKAPDRFTEAANGLLKCMEGLRQAGDQDLRKGHPAQANTRFQHAFDLARESSLAGKKAFPALHARLGCAASQLDEVSRAAAHFTEAIRLYEESDPETAGLILGTECASLLPEAAEYWALNAAWRKLAESPGTDELTRTQLTAALPVLAQYLSEHYQLTSQAGETALFIPVMTPIGLELGAKLVAPGDETDWPLIKVQVPEMRQRIERQSGVSVPGVRVLSKELDLAAESYNVLLNEVPAATGEVHLDRRYCPASAQLLEAVGIPVDAVIPAADPLTAAPGFWIASEHWPVLAVHDIKLWEDPLYFMVRHLEAVVSRNLSLFLGVQEVDDLIERWSQTDRGSALVDAALPGPAQRFRFARALRALVKERVPITSWESILEAVRDAGLESDEVDAAVRVIRQRVKQSLPGNQEQDERLQLPAEIENGIARWIWRQEGKTYLAIPPDDTRRLLSGVRGVVGSRARNVVLIVSNGEVRPFVRRFIEYELPEVQIIAGDELLDRKTAHASQPEGAYSHA